MSGINKAMLITAVTLLLLISLVSAFHSEKDAVIEKSAAAAQDPHRFDARNKLLAEASDPDFGFKVCSKMWNTAQSKLRHGDKSWAVAQVDYDDCHRDLETIRESSRQIERVDSTGFANHDSDTATTLDHQKNNLAAQVTGFNQKWRLVIK
jgi:hypothetical protein